MKLKPDDHIDVKNLVTVMTLEPETTTQLVREMIGQIEALKFENRVLKLENEALLDEILLKGGQDEER